ncbi:MAG TPA: hypothetical protein PK919_06840 [Candidatus Aminicenantes bacterium]|nr:hypothetical protein [Candidatus Aminicenantes bacterium]
MNDNRHLAVSGILFTLVLVAWTVMTALARPADGVDLQLLWTRSHLPLFRAQFVLALLIAPALLYLMLAQLRRLDVGGIFLRLGLLFLAAYLVLSSVSYASQAVLLPRFLAAGRLEAARSWLFSAPGSAAYFLNQLGTCFWGAAAIVLFFRAWNWQGLSALIAGFYLLSAALSILAFAGLLLDVPGLMAMTLPAGLVLFPVGVLTVLWSRQARKSDK